MYKCDYDLFNLSTKTLLNKCEYISTAEHNHNFQSVSYIENIQMLSLHKESLVGNENNCYNADL